MMQENIPSELLLRLVHATPEQMAAIARILAVPGAAVVPAQSRRNVFRRAGSHWDVRFEGGELFHLADTLGAKYLDYLLHHPGEVISAFDLEVAICSDKANARSRDSIQDKCCPTVLPLSHNLFTITPVLFTAPTPSVAAFRPPTSPTPPLDPLPPPAP